MLIPILWSALVSLVTTIAVVEWFEEDKTEQQVCVFASILSIGWAFIALCLCLAAGM